MKGQFSPEPVLAYHSAAMKELKEIVGGDYRTLEEVEEWDWGWRGVLLVLYNLGIFNVLLLISLYGKHARLHNKPTSGNLGGV